MGGRKLSTASGMSAMSIFDDEAESRTASTTPGNSAQRSNSMSAMSIFDDEINTDQSKAIGQQKDNKKNLVDKVFANIGYVAEGFKSSISKAPYTVLRGIKTFLEYDPGTSMFDDEAETKRMLESSRKHKSPEKIKKDIAKNEKLLTDIKNTTKNIQYDAPEAAMSTFAGKVGAGLGSLPTSLVPGATSFQVLGTAYEDAINQGKPKDQAYRYAKTQALLQEAGERVGTAALGKIIKAGGPALIKIGKGFISESTQELSQEGLAYLAEKAFGIKNDQPKLQRFIDAWSVGGVVGAAATGAGASVEGSIKKIIPTKTPDQVHVPTTDVSNIPSQQERQAAPPLEPAQQANAQAQQQTQPIAPVEIPAQPEAATAPPIQILEPAQAIQPQQPVMPVETRQQPVIAQEQPAITQQPTVQKLVAQENVQTHVAQQPIMQEPAQPPVAQQQEQQPVIATPEQKPLIGYKDILNEDLEIIKGQISAATPGKRGAGASTTSTFPDYNKGRPKARTLKIIEKIQAGKELTQAEDDYIGSLFDDYTRGDEYLLGKQYIENHDRLVGLLEDTDIDMLSEAVVNPSTMQYLKNVIFENEELKRYDNGEIESAIRELNERHNRDLGEEQDQAGQNGAEPTAGTLRGSAGASVGKFATTPKGIKLSPISFEGPELFKITKALTGKAIEVRKNLGEGVRGKFRSKDTTGQIQILAELAADPEQAVKTISHEIGHAADFAGDENTMERGNILGRVSSLKRYMKTLLKNSPNAKDDVITEQERKAARKTANKQAGKDKELAKELYRKEISRLIKQRKLFGRDEISTELFNLSAKWRPISENASPQYMRYRKSSPEIYADAISVLLNDPQMLKTEAPQFFEAFSNWIETNPGFLEAYNDVLKLYQGKRSDLVKQRTTDARTRLKEGEQKLREVEAAREANQKKVSVKEFLQTWFTNRTASLNTQLDRARKMGKPVDPDVESKVNELSYMAAEAYQMARDIENNVAAPLLEAGVTIEDIDLYLELRRDATERADKFNPGYITADAAQEMLDAKIGLSDEQFKLLEEKMKEWWKIRSDYVFPQVENANVFSEELLKKMKDNEYYATFNVSKYMDDKYGNGIGASIKRVIGTTETITAPFYSTIMKDAALLRLAHRTVTARAIVQSVPDIFKADSRFVNDRMEFLDPDQIRNKNKFQSDFNPNEYGTIHVMTGGKLQAYYVDKDISDLFTREPYKAHAMVQSMKVGMQAIKDLIVNKNPVWMAKNLFRDISRTHNNIEGMSLLESIQYTLGAFGESYADVFKNKSSEAIALLYKNRALITDRVFDATNEVSEANDVVAYDRMLQRMGIKKADPDNVAKKVLDFLDKVGKVTERMSKVGGAKYMLDRKGELSTEDYNFIRESIGSPDTKQGGKATPFLNNVILFSNARMQGIRGDIAAYNRYTDKKKWFYKRTMKAVLPAVIKYLAISGLLGLAFKDWADKVDENDMAKSFIVPLGYDKNNRARYLAIPNDPFDEFIQSIVFKALIEQGMDKITKVLAETFNWLPYAGSSPSYDIPIAFGKYLQGKNPTDSFRDMDVIPMTEFKAGLTASAPAMLKYTWNTLGLRALYEIPYKLDPMNKTPMDNFKKVPVFGALAKSLYKESDRGLVQKAARSNRLIERAKMQTHLQVENEIIKAVRKVDKFEKSELKADMNALYKKLKADGLLTGETGDYKRFWNSYMDTATEIHKGNDANVRIILNARTEEQRNEIYKRLAAQKTDIEKAYKEMRKLKSRPVL